MKGVTRLLVCQLVVCGALMCLSVASQAMSYHACQRAMGQLVKRSDGGDTVDTLLSLVQPNGKDGLLPMELAAIESFMSEQLDRPTRLAVVGGRKVTHADYPAIAADTLQAMIDAREIPTASTLALLGSYAEFWREELNRYEDMTLVEQEAIVPAVGQFIEKVDPLSEHIASMPLRFSLVGLQMYYYMARIDMGSESYWRQQRRDDPNPEVGLARAYQEAWDILERFPEKYHRDLGSDAPELKVAADVNALAAIFYDMDFFHTLTFGDFKGVSVLIHRLHQFMQMVFVYAPSDIESQSKIRLVFRMLREMLEKAQERVESNAAALKKVKNLLGYLPRHSDGPEFPKSYVLEYFEHAFAYHHDHGLLKGPVGLRVREALKRVEEQELDPQTSKDLWFLCFVILEMKRSQSSTD